MDNFLDSITTSDEAPAPNVTVHPTIGKLPLVKESLSLAFIGVLILLYSIVFVLAIANNCIVLTVILKYERMREIVTNYFLANLAIADITVSVIVLPVTLLSNIFSGTCSIYVFSRSLSEKQICPFARC